MIVLNSEIISRHFCRVYGLFSSEYMRSAADLILTAPTFPEKLLKKHMSMVYIFYSACCFILIGMKNCCKYLLCLYIYFVSSFVRVVIPFWHYCNFDLFSVSSL